MECYDDVYDTTKALLTDYMCQGNRSWIVGGPGCEE